MKSFYIWVLGIALAMGFIAGCDENKGQAVVTAPPDQPIAEQNRPYPAEPEPIIQPPPQQPPPNGNQPLAGTGDTYKPEAPVDDTKRIPPERPARTTRARPRPAPAEHYESTSPARGQTYTVKKGDTLQEISKKFYGTTKKYNKIYQANKGKIKDPNKLSVGMKITIPPK